MKGKFEVKDVMTAANDKKPKHTDIDTLKST